MAGKASAKLQAWLTKSETLLARITGERPTSMQVGELGHNGRYIIYWVDKLRGSKSPDYENLQSRVKDVLAKSAVQINDSYKKSIVEAITHHKKGTKTFNTSLFSPIYALSNYSIRFMRYSDSASEEQSILSYFMSDVAPSLSEQMEPENKELVTHILEEAERIGVNVPVEVREKFALPSDAETVAKYDCRVLMDLALNSLERSKTDTLPLVRAVKNISALVLASEALETHLAYLYSEYLGKQASTDGSSETRKLSIPEYTAQLRETEGFTQTQLTDFDLSYRLIMSLSQGEEPPEREVGRFVRSVHRYLRSWLGWDHSAEDS